MPVRTVTIPSFSFFFFVGNKGRVGFLHEKSQCAFKQASLS